MTYTFKQREIANDAVLYNFKALQEYFTKSEEKVYLKCYESTEEVYLVTAPSDFEPGSFFDYRKNMFDVYVEDNFTEYRVIKYIHEEGLLEKITNDNLVFYFGMCAGDIELCISLEQFLYCLKIYKHEGFTPVKRTSILDAYMEDNVLEATETKVLCPA